MDLEIYSDSDLDCDSDDGDGGDGAATPPVKKARLGAATYKTKFNSQWIKEFPKATCMINGTVAPSFINSLTEQMKIQPFSIFIDGSKL